MLFSNLRAEYSMMSPAEQLFFLFIALCLMQNPIGWCRVWLEITELAQGFSDSHSIKCLIRDILHQVQGVFSVFVLSVATGFLWQLLTTLTWVVTISGNYSGGLDMRLILNTNLTNLSNSMECVNFFPPRITRMLTKFAVLIAFESFARFVHSTNRIVPSGSLSAKFERFERFVLKKLVIERPPE